MLLITEPKTQAAPKQALIGRTLIIVAGRKRTGKDTVFNILKTHIDAPQEFQFATPLKKFCIEVLGLTHDQCYGSDSERETPTRYRWGDSGVVSVEICKKYSKEVGQIMTAREILQVFGTDLLREGLYQNIWAEAGIRAAVNSRAQTCVITDARFPNEMMAHQFFPSTFGKIFSIRLYRDTKLEDKHPSETSLDEWDLTPNQRCLLAELTSPQIHAAGYQVEKGHSGLYRTQVNSLQRFTYLLDNNQTIEALGHKIERILRKEEVL